MFCMFFPLSLLPFRDIMYAKDIYFKGMLWGPFGLLNDEVTITIMIMIMIMIIIITLLMWQVSKEIIQ